MSARGTLHFLIHHPFNRGNLFPALQRFGKWQLLSRLYPECALAVPWVNDVRLLLHRGETGVTGNFYAGLHEFDEMALTLHLLRPGELFVDIGANAGAFTLLACGAAGAHGIAIEPVPSTFRRLEDHMRLNRLESQVKCLNVGLGAEKSSVRLTSGLDTVNHAVTGADADHLETVEVVIETLDAICQGQAPTLLKIDVEGYEPYVVAGGKQTLASPSLLAVIMELNGSCRRYGFDDNDLLDTMEQAGFVIAQYDPRQRELRRAQRPQTFTGNLIFVKDIGAVQDRCRSAKRFDVLGQTI